MSTALEAVKQKPLGQVQSIKELLLNNGARDQLGAVAARHMNPERMMRVVANAIRTTPKLSQCEPMSFLGALMQCAALGLEPNTVLGHAYLIPFDNKKKKVTEVQVIIGYKGLIDLARRSGHITSLSANVHYDDDELWEYEEGTDARLRHRPGPQNGKKLHAYAIAQFKDGGHAYVVLPWAKVMKIRDGSQNWQTAKRFGSTDKSPWSLHEDEMAKKTAIRALAKYLPLSVEFIDAVSIDEQKADYRAFAFDPSAGVQIEADDGDMEDAGATGETIEAEKPAETQTRTKADPKKQASDKEQQGMDLGDSQDQPGSKERHQKRGGNAIPDLRAHEATMNEILGDVLDGADTITIKNYYGDKIAAMREAAPEIFKALMDELAVGLGDDAVSTFTGE